MSRPFACPIDQRPFTRPAAEQLIQRQARHLAENVPQRHVDSCDGRHRDRATPPVRASIEELERVLDSARITPDQVRDQMVREIRRHRELASIQSRVAQPVNARAGLDLQRDRNCAPGR